MSATVRALLPAVLAALMLPACNNDSAPETSGPSKAYRTFFEDLGDGDTDEALAQLAPAGALGDTFRGGVYYMLAREFEEQMKAHGDVDTIIIDREEPFSEDEIMVEGRIRFQNGAEMPRGIRFSREDGRWVGRI